MSPRRLTSPAAVFTSRISTHHFDQSRSGARAAADIYEYLGSHDWRAENPLNVPFDVHFTQQRCAEITSRRGATRSPTHLASGRATRSLQCVHHISRLGARLTFTATRRSFLAFLQTFEQLLLRKEEDSKARRELFTKAKAVVAEAHEQVRAFAVVRRNVRTHRVLDLRLRRRPRSSRRKCPSSSTPTC